MKTYLIFGLIIWGTLLQAAVVIDYKESVNGFGTVAGKVVSENNQGPFVVTLENAGITYSTTTDSRVSDSMN